MELYCVSIEVRTSALDFNKEGCVIQIRAD